MTAPSDLDIPPPAVRIQSERASNQTLTTLTAMTPAAVAFCLFLYQVVKFCKDSKFFVDDPFISMRFAANLVRYGELSFNPGIRVEGYSNLLHVLVHAATFQLLGRVPDAATGINGVVAIVFLAALSQLLVLYGLTRSAKRNTTESTAWYYAWVLTMASLPFAFWAAAGLETPIEGLLYVATTLVAVRSKHLTGWPIAVLAMLLLGVTLLRFEGVLVATAVASAIAWHSWNEQSRKAAPWMVLAVVLPGTGYHLFRLWYFGALLPNTYIAKATGGSQFGRLNAGVHYCGNWLALLGAGIAVVAVLVAYLARNERTLESGEPEQPVLTLSVLIAATFVVSKLVLVTFGGGDWMPGFRMLVPITPFAVFLVCKLLLSSSNQAAHVRPQGLAAACFALAIPLVVRGVPFNGNGNESSDTKGLKDIPGSYVEVGRLLKAHFHGQEEVAIGEAGLIPFEAMDVRFLDMFGLVDADIAHQPGGMHQRVHQVHLVERQPIAVVFAHLTTQPPFGPYQYGPELLQSQLFHANYRRVRLDRSLEAFGWALYVKRNVEVGARNLEWSATDSFLASLGQSGAYVDTVPNSTSPN